jgi:hypothetical protein
MKRKLRAIKAEQQKKTRFLDQKPTHWVRQRFWNCMVCPDPEHLACPDSEDYETAQLLHEILKLRNALIRKEKKIRALELERARHLAKAQVYEQISGKPNLAVKVNHLYANLGPLLVKTLDELSMEELAQVPSRRSRATVRRYLKCP